MTKKKVRLDDIDFADPKWKDKMLDEFEVEKEGDIDFLLGMMAETGTLKESFNEKTNELVYNISEKGMKKAEDVLRTDDGALMMLELFVKFSDKKKLTIDILIECALLLKKGVGVNLLRVIERNQIRIQGIHLNNTGSDEYKKLIKYFDSDKEKT